jgi:hypothetical protein
MLGPQLIASRLLGAIDWQNGVSGFCRCPGAELHTSATRKKDCRVSLDGVPTCWCFHSHCLGVVAEANRRLRRELGSSPWQIILPGGRVLRNGDLLQKDGDVLPREAVQRRAQAEGRETGEEAFLETLRVMAERFRAELLEVLRWPYAEIIEDSPLRVFDRDPDDQFRAWLRLWPSASTLWVGQVYSSGQPKDRTHFRPVSDWRLIGPVMGNYTCASSFKPGRFSRCNENVSGHRFMVMESDSLTHDEIGAVFVFVNRRLRYRLHCIIDTAGKSLHGWFDAPPNELFARRLAVALKAFGCDPSVFRISQPVRVPGAFREGRLQRLVWLKD